MTARPNIVFIVADDLGFADLGCYGGRVSVSPVLDRLAARGLRFTQGYANSPVCSPTRFALMTGRYQYRLRGAAEEPINSRSRGSTTLGLPPEHPTLPSLLRGRRLPHRARRQVAPRLSAGVRTAALGLRRVLRPMSGGVDYFSHCDSRGTHDLWQGEDEHREEGYLTDLISARAVDTIERFAATGGVPFFLSVHYTAPHWPWRTRDDAALAEEVKDNLFHLHGGNIHTYRRMIEHMDEGIGRIVTALETAGVARDTLLVFTSDNGGERFSDSWPLVGGKMDLTEGGIRVPWIAHWPARIAPGGTSGQPCMTMDWSATMLAAAGVEADPAYPLDGVSLLPVLDDPDHRFPRPLYWRMNHRGQRALRDGDWKYLQVDGHDYLFDLPADERERANLGKCQPARLAAMRAAWEAWNATLPPIPADATVSLGYGAADMPQR
jgi:arylsulfatase A-like enzyme